MFPIVRTTISPSRTTGRGAMRCTPRIPTSGWLTSGVTSKPAELAGARHGERGAAQLLGCERAGARPLGERVDVGAQLVDGARRAVADDRHDEPCVGLHGDAEVVAVEVDDLVALEPRIELREPPERLGGRPQHGREQQLQVDVREVALLDERDRGDLAVRAAQVLDDLAPDPAHRLAAALRCL